MSEQTAQEALAVDLKRAESVSHGNNEYGKRHVRALTLGGYRVDRAFKDLLGGLVRYVDRYPVDLDCKVSDDIVREPFLQIIRGIHGLLTFDTGPNLDSTEMQRHLEVILVAAGFDKSELYEDKLECSICRRRHGREIEHPCE